MKMSNCVTRSILVILVMFSVIVVGFDNRKCPRFHIKRHAIIKTQASKAKGATFLGHKDASNAHGCYNECCEIENCNLAMLKFDSSHSRQRVTCFFFDCGSPSKCLFSENPAYKGYAALVFESQDDDNSMQSSEKSFTTHSTNIFTEQPTEKPKIETSEPYFKTHRKQNHGWQSAKTANTEDKDESRDWYVKTTMPTPHHSFGDSEHTHIKTGEEEEKHEEWSSKPEEETLIKQHKQHAHRKKPTISTKSPTTVEPTRQQENKKDYGYEGSESTFDRSHAVYGGTKMAKNEETKAPEPANEKNNKAEPEDEDDEFPRRVWVDNNPDYPQEPKRSTKKPLRSTRPPTATAMKPETNISTKKQETKKQETKKQETKNGQSGSNIVIRRFNIQENKAVIPLAIGLVLSLLLLMAVVFRLRTSRRRRTKAFLTDDADYLINGMYL